MFYIQFSYEQMSAITKLSQQIKQETGIQIRLSDDDILNKIHTAMHDIDNEDIIKTYQAFQDKLKPEAPTQKIDLQDLYSEQDNTEKKHTKKIMYRGCTIEIEDHVDTKTAENNQKKSQKIYRGQVLKS